MRKRLPRLAFLLLAVATWWLGYFPLNAHFQRWVGFQRITDRDVETILGHWFVWQLPAVVLCVAVWLVGKRLGFMPSFAGSLRFGGSPRRVLVTGLIASVVLLAITFGLGLALHGKFGFFPYVPKMLGDLVSNMYEEIVFRGLVFCAFYGAAAAATFPLAGPLSRCGVVAGTIGSCIIFASGHTQYPLALRAVLAVISVVFVWPWVRARSLWAPYIPHTLGDLIGDTLLKL